MGKPKADSEVRRFFSKVAGVTSKNDDSAPERSAAAPEAFKKAGCLKIWGVGCGGLFACFLALGFLGIFIEDEPEGPEVGSPAVEALAQPVAPEAMEAADALKLANVLPESNSVRYVALGDSDVEDGAIAAANVAFYRPEGITIKVYGSPTQRNQARIRMVDACPGCNHLTECGAILLYTPNASHNRDLGIMTQHAKDILLEVNEGLRQTMRESYEALSAHYGCD